MAKVKLEFSKKSPSEKIIISRGIIKSITGNVHYTHPIPTMEELDASVTTFDKANYAYDQDGGTKNMEARDSSEAALVELMKRVVSYVQHQSGGDVAKIRSAGMDIRSAPVPTTSIDIPAAVEAYIGNPTEIDLSWKPVKKAVSYEIQMATDPTDGASWTHKTISTKAKCTITSLESGNRYWFRVSALGPRNLKSPFSDPATSMAG